MGTRVPTDDLSRIDTAVETINANFRRLSDYFDTILRRGGDTLTGVLDANSNRIVNLPDAVSSREPVTYAQMLASRLPGTPGAPGKDGKDGVNGTNGTIGKDGAPGVNGGVGSSAGFGALWAAFSGTTIASGITRVRMAGYDSPVGGGFDVIYDAGITSSTAAANPRTQKIAADGRGFRIDPNQHLTLPMFGVKMDYVNDGNRGTDNYDALIAAITYRPNAAYSIAARVHVPLGMCYTSQTLNPTCTINLVGLGGPVIGAVVGAAPSWIVSAPGKTTLRLKSSQDGVQGASMSYIYGIVFGQSARIDGVLTAHGIHASTQPRIEKCSFLNCSGDGLYIEASTFGDVAFGEASGWVVIDTWYGNCNGNGFHVGTADSNIGYCRGINTAFGIGLAGVRDDSFYQNIYIQSHFAGYGTGGVYYNGRAYQPTQDTTGVTPGTNGAIWHDRGPYPGADNTYPAYNASTKYLARGPMIGTCPAVVIGTYVEGDGAYGVSYMPQATCIGINQSFNDYTANFGRSLAGDGTPMTSTRGVGGARSSSDATSDIFAKIGALEATAVHYRGAKSQTDRAALMYHSMKGEVSLWDYEGDNILWRRFNAPYAFGITAPFEGAMRANRNSPQYDRFILPGFIMSDPINAGFARTFTIGGAAPTTGNYARGDRIFNSDPSPGGVDYWVCVQNGAKSNDAWAATFYPIGAVVNSDGKAWVASSRGTGNGGYSQNAPTGSAIYTDPSTGFKWEPVTQAFIFKAVMLPA